MQICDLNLGLVRLCRNCLADLGICIVPVSTLLVVGRREINVYESTWPDDSSLLL
jgi:hypothetical protein